MSERDGVGTFLDRGSAFDGKVAFSGVVRVDGHLTGEVRADGTLVVGESGRVEARAEVRVLIVYGWVRGEITAKERVEVAPAGRLDGVVRTPRLQVAEGASVNARIAMGEPEPRADSS
jgi:cytoskeletal protein CcmA (bactofilin family)